MATQGIVSVCKEGRVVLKFITGSDGYKADALVAALQALEKFPTLEEAYDLARRVGFGNEINLVVMDEKTSLYRYDDDLSTRYRQTFNQPKFNPRWAHGTADFVRVINL